MQNKPASLLSQKVPFISKLAFGAGDLGTAMTAGILGFFRLFFLTDVAGLPPISAGLVELIIQLWNAINDPIVGALSDRVNTRWGRRRPLMLAGALPMAAFYVLMFVVPPFDITGKVVYYIIIGLLFDTAYTIVNVPYGALNAEMTDDYNERTSLNSFRFSFSILGTLAALILHTTVTGQVKPVQNAYLTAAAILALFVFIPYLFAFWKTYERGNTRKEETYSFREGLKLTLSNKPFLMLIGIYLSSWLALQTAQTMFAYYLTYWLRIKEQLPILFAVQFFSFIGLLLWGQVCKRIGKKQTFVIGSVLWILVMAVLYFVPRDASTLAITILAAIAGLVLSIAYLIPWAMLPDVITLDELTTGQRREGIFYGYFAFLQKLGGAFSRWAITTILAAAAYATPPPNVESIDFAQPESALQAIRLLIGFAPAVTLVLGIYLAIRFPINKAQHEANLAALALKRAGVQAS